MAGTLTPSSSQSFPRSPSSPSLAHAVGLPPPIPDAGYMAPTTPKRPSLKRTREPVTPSRAGEVDSASSPEDVLHVIPAVPSVSTPTPRRKVVNALEGTTPRSAKKRDTLQSRLKAAALPIPGAPRLSTVSTPIASPMAAMPLTPRHAKASDKVVVCMRIKPTSSDFAQTAYELSPVSLSLSDQHPNVQRRGGKGGREAEYTYNFDTVVQYPTRTPELYSANVAPLVDKAMSGFNSTVFAYGQTGSGKSHTMSGTPQELGIIPCAVDGIFDAITADCDRAFLLRVSYLEIYNETIRDLLNFKKSPLADDERPTIHTGKGKVYVDPLVEEIVSTPKDVVDLLAKGNTNRKTGATDWNERSSRSHAVFTIVVESRPRDSDGDDEVRVSRLTLIDLAGSEKAVSDLERRGEGKHINQSLLALREVVHKLTEKGKRSHVPYRNSKLTHLLENVLGGDSNICVICTMSAEEEHSSETLETLKFAGRCSQVETKAQKNILLSSDRAVIRAKDMEIAELKRQLETMGGSRTGAGSSDQMAELAESVAVMEARKSKLAEQLAKLNGEILTSELPRSGIGLPISPPRKKRPRISDFTSLSSAGMSLGLGTPTPKKVIDRRAVSNMARVTEESAVIRHETLLETLEASKVFDTDVIASLRRTLASRDEQLAQKERELAASQAEVDELLTAKGELARLKDELVAAQAEHSSRLSDAQRELESTRSELGQTAEDKDARINALEATILELRKSREELVLEDQERLDLVQTQLDAATKERDGHVAAMGKLKVAHGSEISKIKDAIRSMRAQIDEHVAKATSSTAALAEVEKAKAELAATLAQVEKDRDAARTEESSAREKAQKAAADLESYQRAAMQREADVVTELRAELAREREEKSKLETSVQEEKRAVAEHAERLRSLEKSKREVTDKLSATEKEKIDAERKATDALAAVDAAKEATKVAADAAEAREKELDAKLAATEKDKTDAERTATDARAAVDAAKEASEAAAAEAEARHKELSDKLATLSKESEEHRATVVDLTALLATSKAALDDKNSIHDEAVRELDSLRAGANVADSIRAELDSHRAQLESEKAERAKAVELQVAATGKIETLEATVKEVEESLVAEQTSHTATKDELASIKVKLAELERQLAASRAETVAVTSRAEKAEAATSKLKSELEAEHAVSTKLRAELSDAKTAAAAADKKHLVDLKSLQDEVKTHESSLRDAESRLDTLKSTSTSSTKEIQNSLDETRALLDKSRREKSDLGNAFEAEKRAREDHANAVDAIRAELVAERKARAAAEEEAELAKQSIAKTRQNYEDVAADLARTKAEFTAMAEQLQAERASSATVARSEVSTLEKELNLSRSETAAMRARNERLAAELVTSATSPSLANSAAQGSRRGLASTSSVPGGLSATAIEAVRGQGGMAGRTPDVESFRRSHEVVEIDRLDKVVEAQKAVIEEQRSKIQYWVEQLSRQHEIVRQLTADGFSPSNTADDLATLARDTDLAYNELSKENWDTTPKRHVRNSFSTSSVPSPSELPLSPAPQGYTSSRSRGHISASFTARNLALPSVPTPLPMHQGQKVNVLRKARRITIEHDMDRLQETSKVNRLKSVFDSPEKPSERAGSRRTEVNIPRR